MFGMMPRFGFSGLWLLLVVMKPLSSQQGCGQKPSPSTRVGDSSGVLVAGALAAGELRQDALP